MTKLSVNINKLATLRNARGGNNPDVLKAADDILRFGADGITIHPRPDERHIRYSDVAGIAAIVKKYPHAEFNIEGNPTEQKFIDLVLESKPHQVTLVPDTSNQLTSNHGWNTIQHQDFLQNPQTAHTGHGQIRDGDIGPMRDKCLIAFVGVVGFGHHFNVFVL